MKTLILTLSTFALLGLFSGSSSAALVVATTITGKALCAKCELKEVTTCQTAIRVHSADGDVIYYATDNKVAQKFHPKICKQPTHVTAVGVVRQRDGQRQISLNDIWSEKL